MAGRIECCRSEPSLDELLDDEMMAPVLRSAGFDSQGLRDMMVATARRIDDHRIDDHRSDDHRSDDDRGDDHRSDDDRSPGDDDRGNG
ncbi:MAG TPA: hypothetical protein VND95_06900 [Stellaceae bacterium]|nr:hypothetical protein [Stellaceae bacterium]